MYSDNDGGWGGDDNEDIDDDDYDDDDDDEGDDDDDNDIICNIKKPDKNINWTTLIIPHKANSVTKIIIHLVLYFIQKNCIWRTLQ